MGPQGGVCGLPISLGCTNPVFLSGFVPPPADLSQVEITRAYMAKQADEISLQQADVVLLLGEEDGEWGLHLWAWLRWGTAWVALPQHHRE